MSQNAVILDHLRKRGSITTWVAFRDYRITRLPARMAEIEKAGHLLNDVWVKRGGKRFKAWSLVECGSQA